MGVVVIHILASLPIITGIIWVLILYKRELDNVEHLSKLNEALHQEIMQYRRELEKYGSQRVSKQDGRRDDLRDGTSDSD